MFFHCLIAAKPYEQDWGAADELCDKQKINIIEVCAITHSILVSPLIGSTLIHDKISYEVAKLAFIEYNHHYVF